jgi:hypothetical protein
MQAKKSAREPASNCSRGNFKEPQLVGKSKKTHLVGQSFKQNKQQTDTSVMHFWTDARILTEAGTASAEAHEN